MKYSQLLFLLAATAAQGAVDLDGARVVEPVSEDDPSPIADTLTYIPDQHDCPLPCSVDYANAHRWTPYTSVHRLKRCQLPMLLDISALRPLNGSDAGVLIRSCTVSTELAAAADRTIINATSIPIENPKNGTGLVRSSLDVAPACAIDGRETSGELALLTGGGQGPSSGLQDLLDGMQTFFDTKDNCDEKFLFAWYKTTVASIYIGAGLGKPTVASALRAVSGHLEGGGGSMANRTIAQICGGDSAPETVFGLAVDNTGDIASVQKTAAAWSRGDCASADDDLSEQETLDVKVFDIASAPLTDVGNGTATNTTARALVRPRSGSRARSSLLGKRATCSYLRVELGDGCASLAAKCGIRGADFIKYNPERNLCSLLREGDYVCCSEGDPYTEPKPDAPEPNPDGTCATHLIADGDTCDSLAKTYGLTVNEIESFNKGKTWAWTECKEILKGYTMCLSKGASPLPAEQQGAECGPMVPGTVWSDTSTPMTDLNPCPLKACCSNWGFCGPFSVHCDIHAPEGGGPGAKLKEFQNTCISNCGQDIKQNSGPPEVFSRIGYYESWNYDRPCLWLKAENANTDGSYTHIHWGFAEIDPETWTVVIKDPHNQWKAFKALTNVKKIVSFGGWAYSTEAATYNIIRQAIITNRETFATNAAKFIKDEGLDGIDIDWEYPGAPDIMVGGQPIGQKGDGVAYLRFLTSLKDKLPDKSVSIAAPASYWYLKAFPIDRIGAVIDYIVFMTYDLHGQWDYGNPNAFDECDSGKCIRSHVNLTETRNSLGIITKAGVDNNKIFVGESSYGRSFHMAVDGCSGPNCEFTGTRTESDANPGRCTETRGYISTAEINELMNLGGERFHDAESNTDVLLYEGDYISFMTPTTKDTRREDWKKLNFAGSIDWAVDLQEFRDEDKNVEPERPDDGEEGCVSGESADLSAYDLCEFSCNYGFCPEPTCECTLRGKVEPLPPVVSEEEFMSWDEFDVNIHRLCRFACKYGFCPEDACGKPHVDEWDDGSFDSDVRPDETSANKGQTIDAMVCNIWKSGKFRDDSVMSCYRACKDIVDAAIEEGRTTNYGCVGFWPLDQPIPWQPMPSMEKDPDFVYAPGRCSCDNGLVNTIADTVIEALPIIAQIGCYMVMSTIKLVFDAGTSFIPGKPGAVIDAGLNMVGTAAQIINYVYPEGEDPVGAFEWWLSPCGGSDLVPDDIKQVYDILSTIVDGVTSFDPKNLKKGSGKKGDAANPTDRAKPKAGTGSGPNGTGSSGVTKKRKCSVAANKASRIMGMAKNTMRSQWCAPAGGGASTTSKRDYIITSLEFGATPTTIAKVCSQQWSQACFHYSSAIAGNPAWDSLKCAHGNVKNPEEQRPGVRAWYGAHDKSWLDPADRDQPKCDADEYPPRYLLANSDPEMQLAGQPGGQNMRYLPDSENRKAGDMWKGICFAPHIQGWSTTEFMRRFRNAPNWDRGVNAKNGIQNYKAKVDVNVQPYFRISSYEHSSNPPTDSGISKNKCWPKDKAANDPGHALFRFDPWYNTNPHLYDFNQPYVQGINGA